MSRPVSTDIKNIVTLIKDRARPFPAEKSEPSLLPASSSWKMRVSEGRRLQFPEVVQTALHPDMAVSCGVRLQRLPSQICMAAVVSSKLGWKEREPSNS